MNLCKCFFCGKMAIMEQRSSLLTEKAIEKIKKMKEKMMKEKGNLIYIVGKIGTKDICYNCLEDLRDLSELCDTIPPPYNRRK